MTNVFIHPSAHVSDQAKIGECTKVWINAQIRENACIGSKCIISKDVYVDHGVQIGNNCKIQNSVSVFNGVTIEDDVFVGPNVSFTNDKVPRAFNVNWKITPTLIKKGVSLGANSTVVCGITVGKYAMVAAGSVVTKNVPAFALVIGNPAKLIAFVCECGNRLDNHNICLACGKKIDIQNNGDVV